MFLWLFLFIGFIRPLSLPIVLPKLPVSGVLRMLLKRGMGNGEWGMENGEWGMGNGE